jgi:hypothetical protein
MRDSNSRRPRRRRSGPPGSGDRPPGGGQSNASSGEARGGGSSSGRRPRRRRGGGSSKPLTGPQVIQKYLNLLDQHIANRRKYFEQYDRDDGRHRKRLERNFFASVELLRRFEEKLQDWQREHLKLHVDGYRPDTTYTGNRSISTVADPVPFEGDFADPHFTETQKEAFVAYAEDKEESLGTIDDYLQYKASK